MPLKSLHCDSYESSRPDERMCHQAAVCLHCIKGCRAKPKRHGCCSGNLEPSGYDRYEPYRCSKKETRRPSEHQIAFTRRQPTEDLAVIHNNGHKCTGIGVVAQGGRKGSRHSNPHKPRSTLATRPRRPHRAKLTQDNAQVQKWVRPIARYKDEAIEAMRAAQEQAEQILLTAKSGSRTRDPNELGRFIGEIMAQAVVGNPISASQYQKNPAKTWPGNTFVLCTYEEAREILEISPLRVPLRVVPGPGEERKSCISLDEYLSFLESRESVHVHCHGDPPKLENDTLIPVTLSGKDAVALFRNPGNSGPVNLLDLEAFRPSTPACVELPQLDIMKWTGAPADTAAGKKAIKSKRDLTNCSHFQILGGAGVWSKPHIDRHGVVTSLFCETGNKLWYAWPGLSLADLDVWAVSGDFAPKQCKPVGIWLTPGTLLVQPLGMLHAPFSPTDVLMSGTMMWDSRDMRRVAEIAHLESRPGRGRISNEGRAKELLPKLEDIQARWRHQVDSGERGYWKFGSAVDLLVFDEIIEKMKRRPRKQLM